MTSSLQTAYSLGWTALRRPRVFFARLTENPPFSAALLWLVVLGCLSGLSGLHVGLQNRASYGQDWWREMPVAKAVAQAVWFCVTDMFWASLLAWLLARIARETLRFDTLFTVLAFAMFPCLLSTLTFPLRDVSWLSYHIWQAVQVGVVVWASALVCLGMQACLRGVTQVGPPVRIGRAIQCSLPALLMLWTFGYRAHVASPTSFRAACPWSHLEGKTVRVYYPPDKSAGEAAKIVEGLDGEMQKDCAMLGVKPLPDKISVFCFADDDLQRKLAGEDEEPDNTAHTFWDCITIAYAPWGHIKNQMAHELCHVLLAKRLTDKVHGLLDEGLCEYVAHAVAPNKDDELSFAASPIPLRTLARSDVFFDWEQARETDDNEWTHYTTAESLVTYLIEKDGIEKFKRFYLRVARYTDRKDPDEEQGRPLARAVQEIYGLSLPQLEAQWRHAYPPPAASHASASRSSNPSLHSEE